MSFPNDWGRDSVTIITIVFSHGTIVTIGFQV